MRARTHLVLWQRAPFDLKRQVSRLGRWASVPLLILLIGCCPKPIAVPCPEPPVIADPVLKIHTLKPDATISQILDAYVLDLAAVCGQRDQMKALLDAYRKTRTP